MKPPVPIQLIPQAATHQPLTRSMYEAVLSDDRVQVGSYYAVLADTDDGFSVAKCKARHCSEFVGLLLTKFGEDGSHIVYKQSDITEHFEMSAVYNTLITICIKDLKNSLYSVDKSEINDILMSINN